MWQREMFFQFRPGMHFEDFPQDKIPMVRMEHLRQLDYMISRGVSYERTAYTFLAQIELSAALNRFKVFPNAVVLLNEEGAMIRHDNEWDLIFTPDRLEGDTLGPEDDMYPVYENIINAVKCGEKCWIRLNHVSVRSLMVHRSGLNILDNYCRNYPGGYLAVAENVVINGTQELYSNVPVCRYGALVAVDLEERENYDSIHGMLDDYICEAERSPEKNLRPLSIAVFGAPGSGKSFGVKQIAGSFGKFSVFTLNLSQYDSVEQLFAGLDNALKSTDKIPLVFFDEFDCEYGGVSCGWLKFILAPMQDGEYTLNGKQVTIQRAVFVFAGGTASSFKGFLPSSEEEKKAFKQVKGEDFVSRLRGILNIKGPNPSSVTDKAYVIRRAVLLRDMILRKVPQICDKEKGTVNISHALLSALLRTSEYRHGTRSMEFLLDMSRLSNVKKFTPSCLPMQDQMDIHLDFRDLSRKLSAAGFSDRDIEEYAEYMHNCYCKYYLDESRRSGVAVPEAKVLPWKQITDEQKEEYRVMTRMKLEAMADFGFPIGLRPCTENMPDTIYELYGSSLELLAKLDHDCWYRMMTENGWKYGEVRDVELHISPKIRAFDQLSHAEQESRQSGLSKTAEELRALGLELYRKTF